MSELTEGALQGLGVLVGEWTTESTHPALPGTVVHGQATLEWLERKVPDLAERADHPDFSDAIVPLFIPETAWVRLIGPRSWLRLRCPAFPTADAATEREVTTQVAGYPAKASAGDSPNDAGTPSPVPAEPP